jgi:hypothetical protein
MTILVMHRPVQVAQRSNPKAKSKGSFRLMFSRISMMPLLCYSDIWEIQAFRV